MRFVTTEETVARQEPINFVFVG